MGFLIDNQELANQTKEQAFVLGYELAQIEHLLASEPLTFSRPINAANRERVDVACKRAGRNYRLTWCTCDSSEGWMNLEVADA